MEVDIVKEKYRITSEPILFSFVFTGALSDSVITNLMLRQVCWYDDKLTLDQCTNSSAEDTILSNAQKQVAYIEMYKMLIETVLPVILSLFIGPWSDSNGRKMIMIIPLVGHIITYCAWAGLSLIMNLNPKYLLLSSVGVALTGGFVTVYIGCFCYLTDVTHENNRVIRMGIAEAAINIGQLAGFFVSPYIFYLTRNGYWLIFVINAIILTINVVYISIFLPETVPLDPERNKNLFRLDHLKDMYDTVFEKRSHYGRSIVFLSCSISFLVVLTVFGETNVKYLSTMIAFNWKIENFNLYNAIILGSVFVCSSVGLWIGKSKIKFTDQALLLFSILTRCLSRVLMAISSTPNFFYFASLIGSFISFTGPLVRSQISEIITQNDIGKVFSFLSFIEALTPHVSVPMYNMIYKEINHTFPLGIYLVSSLIFILAAIVVGIIVVLKKMAMEKMYRNPPQDDSF